MSKTQACIAAALAATGVLAAGTAQARTDVHWSIGIHVPVHPAPVYYYPPPPVYYVPPPPVVYRPAPVYYYQPGYYQPAPVYVVHGHKHKHWKKKHHHGRDD